MDSWSYVPGVKNFVSDDFVSQNGMLMMRNQEFEGSGSSIRDVFLSGPRFGTGGQEESRNSPILESNCRDSSLIDLKLGRFLDHKDGQNKANLPAKRPRNGGLSSQKPFCQVHGCRKDLSSSKEYHRRHKVCEIHSKTTKVIVNGIEQRFCQQCSRFHLLAEFDDGKRSCRKRLAGHNERRRKPHIGIHSGRSGRVFHPYSGSAGTGLERSSVLSSFVCQDILPGNVLHSQKYGMQDWHKALKVEDKCDYVRFSNPSSSLCEEDGGLNKMNHKYNPPFMQNLGFHNSHSQNLGFHNLTSIESDQDFPLLDPSTTSSYGCALSLLSSQSQNHSSVHSSALSAHYSIAQVSEKLMRVSPQNSASTGVSNSAASLIEPILISEGSNSVNYGFSRMSMPGAEFMNDAKNRASCQNGSSTIDLLQLSSQLQRVEHERQRSMKVKEDNNAFFGLRII